MSIIWRCECGKTGKVSDDKAGKKGKCPACGSVIHIPLAPPPPPPPDPDADIFDLAEPEEPVKKRTQTVVPMAPPPLATPVGRAARGSKPGRSQQAAPRLLPGDPGFVPPPVIIEKEDSAEAAPQGGRGARDYLYLLTLLALIPLGLSLFRSSESGDVVHRLAQTVKKHPEIAPKVKEVIESDEAGLDELCDVLPGHRLEGSFLARDTWMHWVFALLSAAAFMGLMVLMFPPGHAARTHLIWTGVFTATAGIILLIAFQFVANWTQGVWIRGRGIVVILFYIVKFIGFSYRCADDPNNGLLLSFMGFTLGVGLCEEIVKAIPLLWHFKTRGTMGWRAACLWGFASGVGFGVAEGIMYSSRYYNGIGGGDIYIIRFISCVALHAVWAASAGIFLWKHQNLVDEAEGFFGVLVNAMVIVSAPMILHGAYDTLLKKEMNSWALLVAGVSFLWLVFQIETAKRKDPAGESSDADAGLTRYAAPV